ncbi:MAG: integrase arm-type DNA-binding domain-containing protein [Gammaproteobacteria bacterium]
MAKFTDIFIRSLKPKAKRYDLRETGGRGLGVRVSPQGVVTWCFWYTYLGRKRRMSLGRYPAMSLKAANAARDEAAVLLARGIDPAAQRQHERDTAKQRYEIDQKAPTVATLVHEFLTHHAPTTFRPNTLRQYESRFQRYILPAWGQRKAHTITPRDVVALRRSVSGVFDQVKGQWSGAPNEADRVLSLARQLFKFAVDEGSMSANPARLVNRIGATKPRQRALDDLEIQLLFEHLPHASLSLITKAAIRLMLLTARRVNEVTGLPFAEIDFDRQLWALPAHRNKSKRDFTFKLPQQAVQLLEERQHLAVDQWVFPSPLKAGQPLNANVPTKGLDLCFKAGRIWRAGTVYRA